MADYPSSGSRTGVRVVVAGDRGTGKSSLIATLAYDSFPEAVPSVLPPIRLPVDLYADRVPLTLIDTSSSLENQGSRNEELKLADAVVLTYACDEPMTLDRVSTYWLQELRKLEVKAPVIVVGCKLDLRDENEQVSLEHLMSRVMQQFREIETCIECSAATLIQVPEVFYFAQKAVLYPTSPLYDPDKQELKERCKRALRRIFNHCDRDMDGSLSDAELNEFQVKCFNAPLQHSEIVDVKRSEMNFLQLPSKRAPDQSVELTSEAVKFLIGIFRLFDTDKDRALQPAELDELFFTAPESPWSEVPYKDASETMVMGNISLNGFLSQWALMTLLDPLRSLAYLTYIGYSGDSAAAVRCTRKRSIDRKKQKTERNVFQCFVFGPKNAGKSALLDSLLKRPFSNNYKPTTMERFAVNVVEIGGTRKTLILREIPEDTVKKFVHNNDSLASCDVAIFVFDSSDELSWKRSRELIGEVARRGEVAGYGFPCLLLAAKDDLTPNPNVLQDSVKVTQELGIESPLRISMKSGNSETVYSSIISAAEHPHLGIPETEIGRKQKQYHQFMHHSLLFFSVGAAVAVVGLAAFHTYAARRNSSG
ncbi:Mitochondrial Rho GTPase [Quillaja saponaria]|uniref:Mitochondrial Rho GTPase n=1 Tax=Quillaja saponaria TaxID=32244 RepID=A0AAD7VEK4_QUISA|nr:Mitochondrial Rho GTPase [Quillaja saponaria]